MTPQRFDIGLLLNARPQSASRQHATRQALLDAQIELGVSVPRDYCSFVEEYGAGCIDNFLWICAPGVANPNVSLVPSVKRACEILREIRAGSASDVPYPLWPEEDGIVSWGGTDNGDLLFWRSTTHTIVGCDGKVIEWEDWDLGWSEYLYRIMNRSLTVKLFPDGFPSITRAHTFTPWDERV